MRYLHTMVRVADLVAALDFYCAKLGLVEVRRIENDKGRFTLVFLAAPEDAEHAAKDRRRWWNLLTIGIPKVTRAAAISVISPIA